MSKRSLIMTLLFCLISSLAMGQSYVDVMPGDGTLAAAISAAADGDVLRLGPDGLYTESVATSFGTITNKKISIVVDDDGSVKAKVQMLTPSSNETTTFFFNLGDKSALVLRGLELDGAISGTTSASYLIRFTLGDPAEAAKVSKICLDNCTIKNLKSNVIDGAASSLKIDGVKCVIVDSTFVNNCVVSGTKTVVHYKYVGANYLAITNSTFHTLDSYGVRVSGYGESLIPDTTPETIVDHTTWYNMGSTDPREILLTDKGPHVKPWTVTNSIFAKMNTTSTARTVINIKETTNDNLATITNICLWQVSKKAWLSHTVKDTITMDPGFADPGNGDFTLPAGSILLTFGTDKKAIGDPRWAGKASAVGNKGLLLPESFTLQQNYPNPFNPSTTIRFALLRSGMTTLVIYDSRGREVARPIHGLLAAGSHQVDFFAKDLASGIYLYHLTSSGQSCSKKMLLVK